MDDEKRFNGGSRSDGRSSVQTINVTTTTMTLSTTATTTVVLTSIVHQDAKITQNTHI